MGSSKRVRLSEFFRSADLWEFMALVFTEFTKLSERMRIGNMFAVPNKQIIHFPNDRHRNVQGIANFAFWNISALKIKLSEIQTALVHGERSK